jgi:hypothetical protein
MDKQLFISSFLAYTIDWQEPTCLNVQDQMQLESHAVVQRYEQIFEKIHDCVRGKIACMTLIHCHQ